MTIAHKSELVRGAVYEIRGRNIFAGAWDGDEGFIGLRDKFGLRLAAEYISRRFGGTHIPFDTVGWVGSKIAEVPASIELEVSGPILCAHCGTAARWLGPPAPAPWSCGGRCPKPSPVGRQNQALFNFLLALRPPT